MDVTPLVRAGQQIIQSYSDGGFKVNGTVYEGAAIVTPDATYEWTYAGAFSDISEQDFEPLFAMADELDVVLIGTGPRMQILSPFLRQKLRERGLNAESMDSGAACRTYNVLMAEGRRVAAALLPF